jgi:hypothetical protein
MATTANKWKIVETLAEQTTLRRLEDSGNTRRRNLLV